ncbi:hypothetical protein JG537_08955 [Streptococcus sp. SL1232]|uniref:hypothetical protein n=1 Tax=Streptococcus vicugnae TaxID=2740579 RepID=UPI0018F353A8|nr:hypothetical protein [Streptococcus vicugnae]MBJ7541830.1 hypothetical protein [Streptococcus vicugnae]
MKKLQKDEMMQVHGGAGWFWRCGKCKYKSAWHALKSTAQANADAHTSIYGSSHKTAVYYG